MLPFLSITKLQNLKAIHNGKRSILYYFCVVINHKTTKFESNSQPTPGKSLWPKSCYQSQNYKIWKQFTTAQVKVTAPVCCYQSQNYKIWKQFTTNRKGNQNKAVLLSITTTTKFESNSQRTWVLAYLFDRKFW